VADSVVALAVVAASTAVVEVASTVVAEAASTVVAADTAVADIVNPA
jgi:hypothetical protein